MPAGYHIDHDEGLVTLRAEGSLSLAELVRTGHSLLADERYDPVLPQLLDFRGMRPRARATITGSRSPPASRW